MDERMPKRLRPIYMGPLRVLGEMALVVFLLAMVLVVGYAMPIVLPLIALGVLAHAGIRVLLRRVRGRTKAGGSATPMAGPVPPASSLSAVGTRSVAAHPGLLDALREVDILRGLSRDKVELVAIAGEVRLVPRGAALAKQGTTGTTLYILLAGRVQLTTYAPQGEVTVRIAGPHESLPLAALLGEGTLLTNAYAMTDLRVLAVQRDAFLALCQAEPEIGLQVYRAVADILGRRYSSTLSRHMSALEHALRHADLFANV